MSTPKTILVADIAGGVGAFPEDSDTRAIDREHRRLDFMRSVVAAAGGIEYQRHGDELDFVFPDPDTAAGAAVRLRKEGREAGESGGLDGPLQLRMGFAHGRVLPHETKTGTVYEGSTAILASRLARRATANEILTDEATRPLLSPAWERRLRFQGLWVPQGFPGAQEVYEIPLGGPETVIPTHGSSANPRATVPDAEQPTVGPVVRPPQRILELRHGDRVWTLGPSRLRLDIGRDPDLEVHVAHLEVSWLHATLRWQPSQIEYEDSSRNGSHVRVGDTWVRVHRSRHVLPDSGQICLGPRTSGPHPRVLDFRCVESDSSAQEA